MLDGGEEAVTLYRAFTALHVGEIVFLTVPVGEHHRGSLVRVQRVIAGSGGTAYMVQPLKEVQADGDDRGLVPDGGELTLQSSDLARSLSDYESGIQPTNLLAALLQQVLRLVMGDRPPAGPRPPGQADNR